MTSTSFSGYTGAVLAMIFLCVCSAAIVAPVSAATKYLGGSPSFSASVIGVNEFVPGEDATISVLVKNSGVDTMKQLDLGTIDAEDLPTTAKFVTIGLMSGSDAIVIKTDPQMVGTIPSSGAGVTVTFNAKISTNATTGEYQLPLAIGYEYPRVIRQEKADVFEYTYTAANDTLPLTIHIKPVVKIAVLEAVPDPMSVGTEGYLHLKVQNIGPEDGTKATVKIVRSGSSAIIPTDSTVYIGDFPSGGVVECKFKISASTEATNQTYPVDVLVSYTNREGAIVTSDTETIGIPVSAKTSFTIISPEPAIAAGSESTIAVQYRNNGNSTVYDAQSRINPHGLVTIDDNIAYLGDLKPGESETAQYTVQVDGTAEPGEYSYDSKIRFRDALGNSQESDTITVNLQILPAKTGTVAGLPLGTVVAAIILVVIAAGIVLLAYQRRKKLQ
ncbi:MAG: S-layer protein [Methanoregula sp.]|uniref:COG1361 S-layer family protein n=1 Tax=Methanoregula sp. TaxID=2052170 RepID=UPI003C232553